jgi:Undecaprenyl-phosphate galactose phosphotransferase WbaP
MAEASTTLLQRHTATETSYRGWRRYDELLVARFRKTFVAASLMSWDFVAAIATISFSRLLMLTVGLEPTNTKHLPIAFLILTFLCLRMYTGCGPSPYERFRLRSIGVVGFVSIDFLIGIPVADPVALLVVEICRGALLVIFGHYVEAAIRTILIRLKLWGAPTALFGSDDNSRKLAHLLISEPSIGLTPIAFIENTPYEVSQKAVLPLPQIGLASGGRAAINPNVEFVIFTSADDLAAAATDSMAWISSCRHLLVEDAHDIQSLWLRTRTVGGAIGIEFRRGLRLRHDQILKRAIDLLFAVPAALLACPLVVVLALAIKLADPGPAFYIQKRVGRNATTLRIFKLRTMYADAEKRLDEHLSRDAQARAEWQRFFKLSRDPRVLPIIGNFMRRNSLDELPQLWNIIRGDMSLVGPRPFPLYHMNSFEEDFRSVRVSVPPGLTGLWQVSSRSNGDLQVQKAQDLFYIRNWSIWLDIYILLQTVPAIFSARGAR